MTWVVVGIGAATGAVGGALADPDDPAGGALKGGLLGGVTGGAGGLLAGGGAAAAGAAGAAGAGTAGAAGAGAAGAAGAGTAAGIGGTAAGSAVPVATSAGSLLPGSLASTGGSVVGGAAAPSASLGSSALANAQALPTALQATGSAGQATGAAPAFESALQTQPGFLGNIKAGFTDAANSELGGKVLNAGIANAGSFLPKSKQQAQAPAGSLPQGQFNPAGNLFIQLQKRRR